MEHFFYDDRFCSDMSDLLLHLDMNDDKEVIEALPDDYTIKVELSDLEPIIKDDANEIAEWVEDKAIQANEDRFSEDNCDKESEKIKEAFKQSFDIEKFNSLLPKLYYPNNKFATITKQDLLNAF